MEMLSVLTPQMRHLLLFKTSACVKLREALRVQACKAEVKVLV